MDRIILLTLKNPEVAFCGSLSIGKPVAPVLEAPTTRASGGHVASRVNNISSGGGGCCFTSCQLGAAVMEPKGEFSRVHLYSSRENGDRQSLCSDDW